MVVTGPVAPRTSADDAPPGGQGGCDLPFAYDVFGMLVRSAVALPLPPARPAGAPAWVIRRPGPGVAMPPPAGVTASELHSHAPCHRGACVSRVVRGPGGTWVWHRAEGTFHVSPDARRVTVDLEPGASPRTVALVLTGQVAALVLHGLGLAPLHASAVVTPRGALAFLGPKGGGKSTLAALWLRRGATLLTDDVLPIAVRDGAVYGVPGLPVMKVWPETATCALSLSEELPAISPLLDKRLLALDGRFPFAETAAPLRAVFVLERSAAGEAGDGDVTVQRLRPRDALGALLAQVSWGDLLTAAERARLLPRFADLVTRVPVNVVRYPTGFEHQDTVCARILASLDDPSGPSGPGDPRGADGAAGGDAR